jgi:hypothetical protein
VGGGAGSDLKGCANMLAITTLQTKLIVLSSRASPESTCDVTGSRNQPSHRRKGEQC